MSQGGYFRHAEAVMGTVVSFLLGEDGLPFEKVLSATEAAAAELHRLDEIFSLYREESPMTRYRDGSLAEEELPSEIPVVLALCRQVREETADYFDPWALPGGLDPSGLVKGWAVERAGALLEAAGIAAGLVNGRGDMIAFGRPLGEKRWRVGIRHPWREEGLACVVELEPGSSLATSGRYERGEHLVNPRPGSPARRTASASVVGPSLARADAYATALSVAREPLRLSGMLPTGYESYLVFEDGAEEATRGFPFSSSASDGDDPTEKAITEP